MKTLGGWPTYDLLNIKRDLTRSADHLATMAMREQTGSMNSDKAVPDELVEIYRLAKLINSEIKGNQHRFRS